ncbi:hypothetical protein [Streptomyces sp. NPDC050263]|uniref:hypothetical protein n=1 Tax=Streptomyces sp. NPDC050263 TaxID=3155037 RepID=UPI00343F6D8A
MRLAEVNAGGGMTVDCARPERRFDRAAYGAGPARPTEAHPGLTPRMEPGRALTGYCGWYVTEVLEVKESHGEDSRWSGGGTHHLRTPATRATTSRAPCRRWRTGRTPWPRPAARGGEVTLAGRLCTPKDTLARRAPAPGLRAGDRVAFSPAGAYAWNISHHDFLMHPRPGFRFLDEALGETGEG